MTNDLLKEGLINKGVYPQAVFIQQTPVGTYPTTLIYPNYTPLRVQKSALKRSMSHCISYIGTVIHW